jgi:tRNA modification GTPase
MTADTIAARATPDGRGALAILRLSGPQAIDIAERVFRPTGRLGGLKTQTCIIGHIEDSGGPIDQVVVTLFRSPHSFTGEDML